MPFWLHNDNEPSGLKLLTVPFPLGSSVSLNNEVPAKGKSVPLQVWTGPEGSRKLTFPDFMATAQDGGKVVRMKCQ
jgi:hypothetical protein